ncbi:MULTISPECIES: hypothetical protein [Amycolatopsis]|uniref:hypothetical protein n=1 Tax=Amycolatopsis TaxID=1813 RepID=UPI00093B2CB5|nr:hypothetical protein [Amycolatopsis sp. CB00013]OKK01405.1 hypothetical protein AMK34_07580 [Amycolatopsis sp. CB00013]
MSFRVEADALRDFSKFLEGCREDAEAVKKNISDDITLSAHEEGVLTMLAGYHSANTDAMKGRMKLLTHIAEHAADEIDSAAQMYEKTDKDDAAKLDSTYPGATYESFLPPADDGSSATFEWYPTKGNLDVETDPDELQPKAEGLEKWTREFFDTISWMANIREFIAWACKKLGVFDGDPLDWIVQWFMGEWQAWATCALEWELCKATAHGMSDNFEMFGLPKLTQVWEGKAADAAYEYFDNLKDSIETESEAFDKLYEQYKLVTELAYETQVAINDAVNGLIDAAFEAVAMIAGGGWVMAVWDIVGIIGTIVTSVMNYIQAAETAIRFASSDPVPDTTLKELPGKGKYHDYDHPSEKI